jgi:hypothetical protein
MKVDKTTTSMSVRFVLLSAFALTSPVLGLAAGQHLIRVPGKDEAQDRTGVTRAVQYGKGTGMTRDESVKANAFREQTPAESRVVKENLSAAHPNLSDRALRK